VENFGSFFFRHGAVVVDALKELSILAELHKDVDLVILANHLIYLGNVFMHQVLLKLNLPLDTL
jgi:hypothetical protein